MHALSTSPLSSSAPTSSPSAIGRAALEAHVEFDSRRLFNGTQEVRINHHGQEYRLRQTRNGKLILTK